MTTIERDDEVFVRTTSEAAALRFFGLAESETWRVRVAEECEADINGVLVYAVWIQDLREQGH